MIFFHTIITLFSIFISPYIFLKYRFFSTKNSLLLFVSLILSYTVSWVVTLLFFYLQLTNDIALYGVYLVVLLSFYYLIRTFYKYKSEINYYSYIILLLSVLMLIPLFKYVGHGFFIWDVLASWNVWAIELYSNTYNPIDAAYPILIPSMWSFVYKVQGTTDIWWTAQLILFVLPVYTLIILLTLYYESKNKVFLLIIILLYPYLVSEHVINGNMDMPVMLMGTLVLISLLAAEENKNNFYFSYYVYTAIFLAGVASIVKQPGIVFMLFTTFYLIKYIKYFKKIKKLIFIVFLSLLYFISYLFLYYQNSIASPTGNLKHLTNISQDRLDMYGPIQYLIWLYDNFFMIPESIISLKQFQLSIDLYYFPLIFTVVGFLLFMFKDIRNKHYFSTMNAVFFLFGTIIWIIFFSYDERNALWVKSFFIIFFSININIICNKFNLYEKLLHTFPIIVIWILFIFSFSVNDKLVEKIQKKSQIQAGIQYGCKPAIDFALDKLKNSKECLKIFTNELTMPSNFLLKDYTNQLVRIGRDYKFQKFEYLEHNCSSGSYIVFRRASKANNHEWWKVDKLIKDSLLIPVQNTSLLAYYIPPNINISKDYFVKKTMFSNIVLKASDGNVNFWIEKFVDTEASIFIAGWAFIEKNINDLNTDIYIVISNEVNKYIIDTRKIEKSYIAKHFNQMDLKFSGFESNIYKRDFDKGTYTISLLLINDNNQFLKETNKIIILK